MKKVAAIFLLMLFLVSNSGVAISMHWCGGKLASVDFFSTGGHKCPCGKKAMKKNCCKDKTTYLKALDNLTKVNNIIFKSATGKLLFTITHPVDFASIIPARFVVSTFYHPPPFKPKTPAYIMYGVFLI